VGDAILRFGSINSNNFKGDLAQIGEVVRNMQNQNVQLKVKRAEQQLDLILVVDTLRHLMQRKLATLGPHYHQMFIMGELMEGHSDPDPTDRLQIVELD